MLTTILIFTKSCANTTANNNSCSSPATQAQLLVKPYIFMVLEDIFIDNTDRTDVKQKYVRTEQMINSNNFLLGHNKYLM